MEEKSDIAFDKFIKSKMKAAPVSEPTDADWEGMSTKMKLPNTNRKKARPFIYFAAILILLLTVLLYFVFNEQESSSENPSEIKKEEIIPSKKTEDFQRKEDNSSKSLRTETSSSNKDKRMSLPVQSGEKEKKDFKPALTNPVLDLKTDTSLTTNKTNILVPEPITKQKTDSVNIPKKKKVKYVIKRDTIFSYDTTKVIKKR